MKIAKVCPIYKSGDKSDLSNYRPISILSCFSKIFEKIIANRLNSYIDKEKILSRCQFGFRKQHSTYMAMLKLYDKISEAIDKNEFCVGIFVDLSKAFDTLDHSILIEKLNFYGVRGIPNLLLKSFLTDRYQYVNYNNSNSSMHGINCGVPQGSILGPLLFLIYVNDIDNISRILNFILFADDTNILYSNPDFRSLIKNINSELNSLSDWFKANRLSINLKKTHFINFGYKTVPSDNVEYETKLSFDQEIIAEVDHTKFLGILIDKKLTWLQHVNHISLKIARSLCTLSKLRYKLPKKCLLTLYYTLIYPHLNYCIIMWGSAAKTVLLKLVLLQKRAVRLIDNASYLSHSDPIFSKLLILKLNSLYKLSCIIFMYKIKYNHIPNVCNDLVLINNTSSSLYSLRTIDYFLIPNHRTTLRSRCIKIQGPKLWKSIPDSLMAVTTLNAFKKQVKLSLTTSQ